MSYMRALSIKIPNVSESLETKLEGLVLAGAFWPDKPLASERRLAEEFDVSRTSLRNALANLSDKGLLTQKQRRYHVTNVMADILRPGFSDIAQTDPLHLLDYWIRLFEEVSMLSNKKAQNSDQVEVQLLARQFKQHVVGQDAAKSAMVFERLCRAIFDSCYNFFLSQTHQALQAVIAPYVAKAFEIQIAHTGRHAPLLKAADEIGDYQPIGMTLVEVLRPGFVDGPLPVAEIDECDPNADPNQLIDVTLRHAVSFEAVYELRLITEKHAAEQAAKNASSEQIKALLESLERMSVVADVAPADYSALDTKLHHMIAECTQNPVFAVIDSTLSPVFSRTTNTWLKKHLELRRDQSTIHLQHTEIVKAIEKRDPSEALAAMEEHLAYVLRNLRYLRQQDHLHEVATARRLLA